MYDAADKRFMAKDPVKGTVLNPQTLIPYSYVLNNPLKYVDPTGQIVSDWDMAHLTPAEQAQVENLGKQWNKANEIGDRAAMDAAHDAAEAIREPYRSGTEHGTAEGYTVGTPASNTPSDPTPGDNNPTPADPPPQSLVDFQAAVDEVNSMSPDELLDYAVDLGIMSQDTANAIKSLDESQKAQAASSLKQAIISKVASDMINSYKNAATPTTLNDQTTLKYIMQVVDLTLDYFAYNNMNTGISSLNQTNLYISSYFRQLNPSYIGGDWPGTAGAIDQDFIDYINAMLPELATYFSVDSTLYGADLPHMFATLSALFYESNFGDGIKSGLTLEGILNGIKFQFIPEGVLNNLAGWAGDLQQLMKEDVFKNMSTNDLNDYNAVYNATKSFLGNQDSHFPLSDLYADVDAVNLYNLTQNTYLFNIINGYYTRNLDSRMEDFAVSITGIETPSRQDIYEVALT